MKQNFLHVVRVLEEKDVPGALRHVRHRSVSIRSQRSDEAMAMKQNFHHGVLEEKDVPGALRRSLKDISSHISIFLTLAN